MSSRSVKYVPCDLLSHFITHSYLTLVENLTLSPPQVLDQSLQSFLFICNHTPNYTTILQKQIFDLYNATPTATPTETLKSELELNPIGAKIFYPIRNNLTFKTLNKTYSQQLLKTKLPSDIELWARCNIAYIHLHQSLSQPLPVPLPKKSDQLIQDFIKPLFP